MYADKPLKIKWGDLEDENLAELYYSLEPLNISSESLSCPSPNEKKDGPIDERPSSNEKKDRTINDGLELLTVGVLSSESIQEKKVVAEVSIVDSNSVSSNVCGRETSEKDAGREPGTVHESCQASCDKAEGNFISSQSHAQLCQGASASNQALVMPESSGSQNALVDDLVMANIESKKIPSDKIGGDKELSKCLVSSGFVEGFQCCMGGKVYGAPEKKGRAKAQQEEAELLAQKLAERLSESESRRKFYLEQIRERALMDFRDQSSPCVRRSSNKENCGKFLPVSGIDDNQTNCTVGVATKVVGVSDATDQQSLKRRIKKIRQAYGIKA